MKFEQALQEATERENKVYLSEGFRRYAFKYKGSRPWYKIHDKHPFVLAIDDNYNVDKRGRSLLGINMHYFEGSPDRRALFKKINAKDDDSGYKGFDVQTLIDRDNAKSKKKFDKKIADKRIERYDIFKHNFPQLLPFLRRYKYSAIDNIRRTKEDDVSRIWKDALYKGHEGD